MHVDVANKNPATVRLEGKHMGPSTPIYNDMMTTFRITFLAQSPKTLLNGLSFEPNPNIISIFLIGKD